MSKRNQKLKEKKYKRFCDWTRICSHYAYPYSPYHFAFRIEYNMLILIIYDLNCFTKIEKPFYPIPSRKTGEKIVNYLLEKIKRSGGLKEGMVL